MDVPSRSGDPLAQPTRARLFALLSELRRSAPTEELAERLGLHPNGVRSHLERLEDAGLILRRRERRPRGRPRDVWMVDPAARPGGDPPTAYADLGRWLVRAMTAGRVAEGDVEAVGREIGHEIAPARAGAPAERRMYEALSALGFAPQREPGGPERLTYRLGNCPYRRAVRENQEVVCCLHRGLTRGLLDVIDDRTDLAGFVPKDPDAAGCLIHLHGPLAAEGTPS